MECGTGNCLSKPIPPGLCGNERVFLMEVSLWSDSLPESDGDAPVVNGLNKLSPPTAEPPTAAESLPTGENLPAPAGGDCGTLPPFILAPVLSFPGEAGVDATGSPFPEERGVLIVDFLCLPVVLCCNMRQYTGDVWAGRVSRGAVQFRRSKTCSLPSAPPPTNVVPSFRRHTENRGQVN